ncbi:Putative glutathionine S-transferase [Acinetobacter baumannii]|uniref:glutathione binding-like protein n=1 Tax=Acinetobacter baumannii TaxID=470 RepID=UPI000317B8EF|nr:glutathione binding-like protein [Acinetobacter baumannii]EHT1071380.1 glutathione S-transferase family protein [Acinetobacter baumannii]EJB8488384.1 glutathione S-transferase family protein [Acinetobacter baumannii]EKV7755572.1 glutathione S-transferase family protein [Acinetobacter baumannii]EKW7505876.1 glutathione S-transferase family protein [Acinetobacter baumannii]EKW8716509.1 glutathione S-transferase family protein [Acinetobacter baumannii]
MRLFFYPHACSMAIHIALKETGQEFDTEFVDLSTKVTGSGLDYLKINPKRAVPALGLENGKVITEVTTILTYLADLVPEKNLIPKSSSFERYEMMSLLSFISMDIHKNFSAFFYKEKIDSWIEVSKHKLSRSFDFIENKLQSNQYLNGNEISIADFYFFVMLHWCDYFSIDLEKWPKILNLKYNLGKRSSVQEVLKFESSIVL